MYDEKTVESMVNIAQMYYNGDVELATLLYKQVHADVIDKAEMFIEFFIKIAMNNNMDKFIENNKIKGRYKYGDDMQFIIDSSLHFSLIFEEINDYEEESEYCSEALYFTAKLYIDKSFRNNMFNDSYIQLYIDLRNEESKPNIIIQRWVEMKIRIREQVYIVYEYETALFNFYKLMLNDGKINEEILCESGIARRRYNHTCISYSGWSN